MDTKSRPRATVPSDRRRALTQLERVVRLPDGWLLTYNRSERYESLRRDPRGKAALESIESW